MTDLEPCPFCGAAAHKSWSTEYGDCARCSNKECAAAYFAVPVMAEDWNRRTPPEGMALVPRSITADTGHKAGMMSEFSQSLPVMCESCDGDGEDEHDDSGVCSDCGGLGEQVRNVNISWTTIKAIHRRIVELSEGDKS